MTSETELTISFVSDESVDSISLEMYQDLDESLLGYPSFADVSMMIAYARAGKSARQAFANNPYIRVSSDDEVSINLDFYVKLYPIDLEYSLESNHGDISEMTIEEVQYSESHVIGMTNKLEFDTEIHLSSLSWLSRVYNSVGDLITPPSYTVSGNKIIFSQEVFGVVKLVYTMNEHKYTLNMNVPKTAIYKTASGDRVINQSLTGFNPIVMAKYMDDGEEESKELQLDYPKLVSDFLETCPYQDKLTIDWGSSSIGRGTLTTYYYSTCTGEILDTHRVELT